MAADQTTVVPLRYEVKPQPLPWPEWWARVQALYGAPDMQPCESWREAWLDGDTPEYAVREDIEAGCG